MIDLTGIARFFYRVIRYGLIQLSWFQKNLIRYAVPVYWPGWLSAVIPYYFVLWYHSWLTTHLQCFLRHIFGGFRGCIFGLIVPGYRNYAHHLLNLIDFRYADIVFIICMRMLAMMFHHRGVSIYENSGCCKDLKFNDFSSVEIVSPKILSVGIL